VSLATVYPLELAPPQPDYDPLVWVGRLAEALERRRGPMAQYAAYYDGNQATRFTSENWRRAFGGRFHTFSDNWCQLVVDAVEERLNIEGFRFGDDAGDSDAWEMWQRNGLDADSQLAHVASLTMGVSFVSVWVGADGLPEIDVESPEQTIVAYVPGSRRKRAAALKMWAGGDDLVYANLYMADYIWKWQAKAPGGRSGPPGAGWLAREVRGELWPLPNPLGVVPVVPLVNRPRIIPHPVGRHATEGASEIASVVPVQDAINVILENMMVASEFGAFRQRWVTGMDIPRDPETGQAVEPFRAAVDRLWMAENPEVKFGEFGQTDLAGYVKEVEMLVQHIASQTRTPPHYFYLSGQFPSGESIKSAETGLVAKATRKMRFFGEPWEEVMRLAFAIAGDARSTYTMAETIWADPESRSESAHIDALVKMRQGLGIPAAALYERAGFSPQEIARFPAERAEDAFLGDLAAFANNGGPFANTGQPGPPALPRATPA
jgi:hypothetical protein